MRHALHVLLYDGLQFLFHGLLDILELVYLVALHELVGECIHAGSLLTVKLEHVAIMHVLVDAVQIVHGPGILFWCVEEVDAEAEVGFLVVEHAHHCRQDINLLGYLILYLRFPLRIAWFIDDDR